MKEPIFYRVIVYLLLTGLIPSFGTFGYYFMLDVVQLSKFTVAILGVLGYACLMIGSSLYNYGFNKKEFRTLVVYNIMLTLCFAPMNLLFATRQNEAYGMSDLFVIIFTDVVSDTLSSCLVLLPIMVLFAKITPKRIEATAFAFLTGTSNLTSTMRGFVGSWVNSAFVGVTQEDLSRYYILVIITIVMSVTPLFYLRLLPTRAELDIKEKREEQEAATTVL